MRFTVLVCIRVLVCAGLLLMCHSIPMFGQQSGATAANLIVPPLVQFSGVLTDVNGKPLTEVTGVTFSLYKDSQGGAPLWMETQNVQPNKAGYYSVLLGATSSQGLPLDLFVLGEARWLGVQPQGQSEQPRVLLLSVPYALKAGDAETVGGLPPSAFVLATPAPGTATAISGGTNSGAAGSAPPVGTITGSGTVNFLPLWTGTTTIGNSVLFQSGTGSSSKLGINTNTPASTLDVKGSGTIRGLLSLPAAGTATSSKGANSQPFDLAASAFNSGTNAAVTQTFQWQAEPTGNNTSSPSGTLNLLFGSGTSKPAETGLKISNTGIFTFATGQTFPGTGSGTITGVTAGTDLTGGGASGNVTVNLDTTKVPQLTGGNSFSGNQSVNGNVSATQLISNVAAGTAPLQVTSTTLVPNLNASFLGGFSASAFQPVGSYATVGANTFGGTQTVSTGDVSVSSGNLNLPATTSATVGVVNVGGTPFFHACCSAINNIFIGPSAGNFTTTGPFNTGAGYRALTNNTSGGFNVGIGASALGQNTGGYNNTAVGEGALSNNTTGITNTATGSSALQANTTGIDNTADGFSALQANSTGQQNTAEGMYALFYNTSGTLNTAIGYASGNTTNFSWTTGSNNTFVGYNANPGAQSALNNATAIGASAQVTASNALVLGSINGVNGATASVNVGIGTTAPAYSLDVHGTGNFTGLINFASGQTFPGTGTITAVTTATGSGLTGGGTSGALSLALTNTCAANQVLQWNGSSWACAAVGTGTITGVNPGTDLLGGGNSGAVTLSVDTSKVVTGVNAGTGLTGGGTGGTPTLSVDPTQVPLLNAANNTFNGNLNILNNANYQPLSVQSSSTFGTWLSLINTSTSGKQWSILSAGGANAEGAGNLGITNFTGTGNIYLEGNVKANTLSINNDLTMSASPRMFVSGIIQGALGNIGPNIPCCYTYFIPDHNIVVTRVTLAIGTPANCGQGNYPDAVGFGGLQCPTYEMVVPDGVVTADSGPISVSCSAGAGISIQEFQMSQNCSSHAQNVTITLQYAMQ